MSWFYRCLGVSLGPDVVLHAPIILEPDLLSIDKGAYIAMEAELRCHNYETGGVFVLGDVHVGVNTTLGPKATTQPGCFMHEGSSLGPLSALQIGQTISGSWTGNAYRRAHMCARACLCMHTYMLTCMCCHARQPMMLLVCHVHRCMHLFISVAAYF